MMYERNHDPLSALLIFGGCIGTVNALILLAELSLGNSFEGAITSEEATSTAETLNSTTLRSYKTIDMTFSKVQTTTLSKKNSKFLRVNNMIQPDIVKRLDKMSDYNNS